MRRRRVGIEEEAKCVGMDEGEREREREKRER